MAQYEHLPIYRAAFGPGGPPGEDRPMRLRGRYQARALGLGLAVALVPEMGLLWSAHRARRPVSVVVPAGSSKRVTSLPPAT